MENNALAGMDAGSVSVSAPVVESSTAEVSTQSATHPTPTISTVSILDTEEWGISDGAQRIRVKTSPGEISEFQLSRLRSLSKPVILDFNCSAQSDDDVISQVLALQDIVDIVAVEQPFAAGNGKTLISSATNQAGAYLAKGSNWATSKIYPKVGGVVQSREGAIKNEVNQEKQKVSQNIVTQVGNYFSGIANSIAGKNNSTSCPAPTTNYPH